MTVLLLRLAGPLQAWGERSRFARRETAAEPTKSGVLGLLAAARGLRRTDPIEELTGLTFGVRVDQPGRLVRDFQTARNLDGTGKPLPLSVRYYLGDARFLAAVEGEEQLLTSILESLRNPHFPLYLGRRSCPPAEPVARRDALREGTLTEVLLGEPWSAAAWHRRTVRSPRVRLTMTLDESAVTDDPRFVSDGPPRTIRDVPVSFDPRRREYGYRSVVRGVVEVDHPDNRPPDQSPSSIDHDPFALLGGI